MTTPTNREIHLASRPEGWPTAENFRLVEVPVPEPGPGQVVVRNRVMSVDPYMRGRMNAGESYIPSFRVGEAMDGGAVGEVVASASPGLAVGDTVLHGLGWREYARLDADKARKVDTTAAPLSAYLGALGMVGLTAYVGLLDIAAMRPRDTVFVSGAAGAVGSIAGQIAKLRGSPRVIGSAGSAAKVEYVTRELGFDAAFNYHDGPVAEQLKAAAPDGIDVYFDNVGGDHLEAAIDSLNLHGRVALCGAISQYNAEEAAPGPRNLFLAVGKRLTLRGFLVGDHADRMPDFVAEVGAWLREGRLRVDETVVEGIENAPEAFLSMLRGANRGKMLVRLA
ncbi:NADP-dependent oxidoreductase [Planosporangium mesophilum]|uniref:NADP-dependent oxidoreductase n=1 Tax=Planosporangium mesophilum TaxID=689768 RepID=A0A8J3WZT2_9ACTN|nr:NADP-dependent oxidoreductase [Planosporangium mesophilum]NJC83245.1 NADP-dependent oxidoreductase [Planosporangium mesophilum]GII21619.1 NADP-dependent oxidoreductase [Planosporangium mesophilum]